MSGCHGKRPYENGFTLPTAVPAVIGGNSLERFETMGQVYGFMSSAMPFQDPGHLTQEEYLAIAAFLARSHDAWDGTTLTSDNIGNFRLRPAAATETPEPAASPVTSQEGGEGQGNAAPFNPFIGGIAAGVIGSLVLIVLLIKRRT